MSLESHIVKLLKDEGYKLNEAIRDGLDEFLAIVEEENEGMEEDFTEDEEELDEE